MRIGYPCINRGIGCKGNRTFRLRSYSEDRLVETVRSNLECLARMLRYNATHSLGFFRITSDLVPFASHPVCTFPWEEHFVDAFRDLGLLVLEHSLRVSMHPDQFVLLNSPSADVTARSIAELQYHVDVLEAMGLDTTAKVQIHVGGAYGDRRASMARFAAVYAGLEGAIRRRLVVENDDRIYSLKDCMHIHEVTGVPIVFDWFHHQILSAGESLMEALTMATSTWQPRDGLPIVDYSSQKPGARRGSHAETIDEADFTSFLDASAPHDFDLMLEIKDKEASALCAADLARHDPRFLGPAAS